MCNRIIVIISYNILLCASRLCSCTRASYHGCNYTIVYVIYLSSIIGDCPHGSATRQYSLSDLELIEKFTDFTMKLCAILCIYIYLQSFLRKTLPFLLLCGKDTINRRFKFDHATHLSKLEIKLPRWWSVVVQLTESCSKAQTLGSQNNIFWSTTIYHFVY